MAWGEFAQTPAIFLAPQGVTAVLNWQGVQTPSCGSMLVHKLVAWVFKTMAYNWHSYARYAKPARVGRWCRCVFLFVRLS